MGRIDLAWFECPNCKHRCTSPETINVIPHEMEEFKQGKFTRVIGKTEPNTTTQSELETLATTEKTRLSTKHTGNTFKHEIYTNETVDNKRVNLKIKFDRSYAKVLFQSNTSLENSKEIKLGCPQCNTELYHVIFPRGN